MGAGHFELKVFGDFDVRGVPLRLGATFGDGPTIFEARIGALSLGDVVRYLVRLAAPGLRVELTPPWDVLNSIALENLILRLDATGGRVGIVYEHVGVDLAFLKIDALDVWYTAYPAAGRTPAVEVGLYGRFLDKTFAYPDHPLRWDLLTQPPPAVPSGGTSAFHLEYLGLGQRVTLRDPAALVTMKGIIDALEGSYADVPPARHPLDALPALTFDAGAGWLIAARFSVLDTLSLSVIFNDPALYGVRLELAGERAKQFAGLEFEVLYRRVSDEIGVYHIELQLPDSMRQIDMGAVSITVPVVVLEIYTNGEFLVDVGFPHHLDFTRSFTLQAFVGPVPVIGAGGVYFGVLSGTTSAAVPAITNGRFAPVVAFGLGLQIGVGRTFNRGILRAGIVIAIEGIAEGVLGFFEPEDPGLPKDTYYRASGTIALVGHIYGEVNLEIVKARVDVYAYASVSVTFEACQATTLVLEAGVSVHVSVKVTFFHVHLSFSATVRETVTLGRPSPAPWRLAPGAPPRLQAGLPAAGRPLAAATALALQTARPAWEGRRVVAEVATLDLYVQPMVTCGDLGDRPPARSDGATGMAPHLLALLFIARGGTEPGSAAGFDALARAALDWALQTMASTPSCVGDAPPDEPHVTRSALAGAADALAGPGTPDRVGVCEIVGFLRENFQLRIRPMPTDAPSREALETQSLTLFPMPPYLSLRTSDAAGDVDFETFSRCSPSYRDMVETYFAQLAMTPPDEAAAGADGELHAPRRTHDAPDSLAAFVFADYVLIVLRQIVHAALEVFDDYVYQAGPEDTLAGIAGRAGLSGDDPVGRLVMANQDHAEFFAYPTTLHLEGVVAQILDGESLDAFATRVTLDPAQLAASEAVRNRPGLLRAGAVLRAEGGTCTVQPGETIDGIAGRLGTTVVELVAANAGAEWLPAAGSDGRLPAGEVLQLPAMDYSVKAGDTFAAVAARVGLTVDALAGIEANRTSIDLLVPLAQVPLPPVPYTVREDETPLAIARRFGIDARRVLEGNSGPPTTFGRVRLPECERLPRAVLHQELDTRQAFAMAAATVARFLLGGLRLPDPSAFGGATGPGAPIDPAALDLYPLYVLTGQQWPAPAAPSTGYVVTLSRNVLRTADAEGCQRPLITFLSERPDQELALPLSADDVALIAGYRKLLDGKGPPFDPAILSSGRIPPYTTILRVQALGTPLPWEAAVVPRYGQEIQAAGMPVIFTLPPALRAQLRAHPAAAAQDIRLLVTPGTVPGDRSPRPREITARAWGSRIDIRLQRVADPARPEAFLASTYQVFSGSPSSRDLLLDLIAHLRDHPDLDGRIDLLYPANPTSPVAAALRSDAPDPSSVLLLKTNLSTVTRPPAPDGSLLAVRSDTVPAHATLADPRAFLTLLWEASIVNTGGACLFYQIGDEGAELPPQLFGQDASATLSVLVTVFPASDSTRSIPAAPFHNCVVCVDNLGDAAAVVSAAPPLFEVPAAATLQSVAKALGITRDELARANATVAHLVRPGIVVALEGVAKYTVQLGDSLLDIALLQAEPSLSAAAAAVDAVPKPLLAGARVYTHPDWVAVRPMLAPGHAGIRVLRTDADPQATSGGTARSKDLPAQDTPARRLQVLFHLLGCRLTGNGGFRRSAEGLPIAPAESRPATLNPAPADVVAPWRYQRTLPVAADAGSLASPRSITDGGPRDGSDPADPYGGLGQDVRIGLRLYDLFGNRCVAPSLNDLSIPIRYSDPVIGLSQWPGAAATYEFSRESSGPQLTVRVNLDVGRYSPALRATRGDARARAQADRSLYQRIRAQLAQPDVSVMVSSTLEEQEQPLRTATFLDFASDACRYLGTVQAVVQVTVSSQPGDTFARIAARWRVRVDALGAANATLAGLLQPRPGGILVPLLYVTVRNDTLADIAARAGDPALDAGAVASRNPEVALQPGTTLSLGGRRHAIGSGDTIASLAEHAGLPPDAIGRENAGVANLFASGTVLLLRLDTCDLLPGDTLASVAGRHGVTVNTLVTANAEVEDLIAGDARDIAIPDHVTLGDDLHATDVVRQEDTLDTLAARHGITAADLLAANSDVADLPAAATPPVVLHITVPGMEEACGIAVEEGDTFATILGRFRDRPGCGDLSIREVGTQNAGLAGLLRTGARVMIPPARRLDMVPVAPVYPAVIFPLAVRVAIRRRLELVDPALRDDGPTCAAEIALAPQLADDTAWGRGGDTLDLTAFAQRFRTAFPELRVASSGGRPGDAAPARRLMAMQFQNSAFSYRIERTADVFALAPLLNRLWSSRPDAPVPIRPYANGTLGEAVPRAIHAADLDAWGRRFLEDVDRFLSPASGIAAWRLTSGDESGTADCQRIVEAKTQLAEALRDRVAAVLDPPPDEAGRVAAGEVLYQRALVELSDAYAIDAIVQFPVVVRSPFEDPATAPRFMGTVRGATFTIPEGSEGTLAGVARAVAAPIDLVAEAIADTPYILVPDHVVSLDARSHRIAGRDTLRAVAAALKTTLEALVAVIAEDDGLLASGAALQLTVTTYTTAAGDTLRTALDYLGDGSSSARDVAVFSGMNSRQEGVLRAGAVVALDASGAPAPDGPRRCQVGPHDTIQRVAEQLGTTVEALIDSQLDIPGLVSPGVELRFLSRHPACSLSEAKVVLAGDSTLTFLLQAGRSARRRHLSIDLSYHVTEIEHDIADVAWADGYQSSRWLSLVEPIVDRSMGRTDVPLALRRCPLPPAMIDQQTRYPVHERPALPALRQYDYLYTYAYAPAAQDEIDADCDENVTAIVQLGAAEDPTGTLPYLLACYDAVATLLWRDLSALAHDGPITRDPAARDAARGAIAVFAEFASRIAKAWQTWTPDERPVAVAAGGEPVARARIRVRTGGDIAPRLLIPATDRCRVAPRRPEAVRAATPSAVSTTEPDQPVVRHVGAGAEAMFMIERPALDALRVRNIRGRVAVTRNAELLPARRTNPRFVYRTDTVRFSEPIGPMIVCREPLDMLAVAGDSRTGEVSLEQRLAHFIGALLDVTPDSPDADVRFLRIAVSYLFPLNDAERAGMDTGGVEPVLYTEVPIALRPVAPFLPGRDLAGEAGLCHGLAEALEAWTAAQLPPGDRAGRFRFGVTVYSSPDTPAGTAGACPLIDLSDVRLRLADIR